MKPFKQALEEVIQEHDEITHKKLLERIKELETRVYILEAEVTTPTLSLIGKQ